jgi:hypothetical protein
MAIGCAANWLRNRTFHCALTGPIFFIAAILLLLTDLRMARVNEGLIWPVVFFGAGVAFLLEWRYAKLTFCVPKSNGLLKFHLIRLSDAIRSWDRA